MNTTPQTCPPPRSGGGTREASTTDDQPPSALCAEKGHRHVQAAPRHCPGGLSDRGFPRFTRESLEANQPIVDLVTEIAARKEVTPGQVALAWLLAKSPSIVPIPGSRRTERVTENIKAADINLTATEVEEIDARSADLTVTGARGSGHESYR
jgi:aryl-alcohol dehydrogenase-like predicted oxidoreductase